MLMSRVIGIMLVLALVCGALTGSMQAVSQATLAGARDGVQLVIQICGAICLWSGLMEVMDRSGLGTRLAGLLRPVIVLLFGKYGRDAEAAEAIAQNMAANLLGLGNAATPAGLRAAKRLHLLSQRWGEPPDAVFLLIVINTSSLQLLPTTVAAVRAGLGSAQPFDLLPAVWLSTLVSVAVGILLAKSMKGVWRL